MSVRCYAPACISYTYMCMSLFVCACVSSVYVFLCKLLDA